MIFLAKGPTYDISLNYFSFTYTYTVYIYTVIMSFTIHQHYCFIAMD